MTMLNKLLARVDKQSDGCWLFTGPLDRGGYGLMPYGHGVVVRAHRLSYELHHGSIPEGKLIMHTCDIPGCINPEHLKIGTAHENTLDMIAKGRRVASSTKKTKGSFALTEANIHAIRERFKLKHTNVDIAATYRVTETAIRNIRNGKSWGWLS